MRFLARCARRLVNWWIKFQVELHGQYSFERLRDFDAYTRSVNVGRVVAICMLTPVPCLVLITLIDCVPLAPPEDGTNANYVHWIRNFFTVLLITYAVLSQFRHTVPGLPLDSVRITVLSVLPSLAGVGAQYIFSHSIGFPLPFSLVMGTPPWAIVIFVLFAYYFGKLLRENIQFQVDLGNYMFVFLCQISLTFIYPAYIYGFVTINPDAQTLYIALLPILKIALKNWISHFLGDLDDMKPEIVIFNVEIFNALYVSCCMQRSPSITTTLLISFVDWVQAFLSLRDINELHLDVKNFMRMIPDDHAWHGKTFVEVALLIIDKDPRIRSHASLRASCVGNGEPKYPMLSRKSVGSLLQDGRNSILIVPVVAATDSTACDEDSVAHNEPATKFAASPRSKADFLDSERARLRFVQKVTQLLFTSEFVVLIEYTEVIVPIIYSIYVVAAYHLENREYYAQLADMDAARLTTTVSNVLMYSGLELFSLLVMSSTLKRRLGIATFKQLSFVLEKQWKVVQAKLLLWFFYVVQSSLYHFGKCRKKGESVT